MYIVGSQTLSPGTMVTLNPGLSETVASLVTNTAGEPVAVISGGAGPASSITFGSQIFSGDNAGLIFTSNDDGAYIVGGQTLVPSSTVTLSPGILQAVVALTTDIAGEPVVVIGGGVGPASSIALASKIVTGNNTAMSVGTVTLKPGLSQTAVSLMTNTAGGPFVGVDSAAAGPIWRIYLSLHCQLDE